MKSSSMGFDLNRYDKLIRISLFTLSIQPLLYGIYAFKAEQLGINPFEALMSLSGHAALVFLLISLAITPVRRWLTVGLKHYARINWGKRLSDWNLLIRTRRMFGVFSFFYATLHMGLYLELELSWLWQEFVWEIQERYFLTIGLICWCLLLLLTATSPKWVQKKTKRWWRRTHRLVYPLSILACLHFLLGVKETNPEPYYYLVVVMILLGHRVVVAYLPRFTRADDVGMELNKR